MTLAARRQPLVIDQPIRVGTDARWLQIVPCDVFRISYTLDSTHPVVGTQAVSCEPTEHVFVEELAPARTYGFLKDVGNLRKNGLAQGGSLDNAIVVGKRGVLNELRYRDEFVRHKVLDLIGDLALIGRPIAGEITAVCAGHALHSRFVEKLLHETGFRDERSRPRCGPPPASRRSRPGPSRPRRGRLGRPGPREGRPGGGEPTLPTRYNAGSVCACLLPFSAFP